MHGACINISDTICVFGAHAVLGGGEIASAPQLVRNSEGIWEHTLEYPEEIIHYQYAVISLSRSPGQDVVIKKFENKARVVKINGLLPTMLLAHY